MKGFRNPSTGFPAFSLASFAIETKPATVGVAAEVPATFIKIRSIIIQKSSDIAETSGYALILGLKYLASGRFFDVLRYCPTASCCHLGIANWLLNPPPEISFPSSLTSENTAVN
eukprot:sb/3476811/